MKDEEVNYTIARYMNRNIVKGNDGVWRFDGTEPKSINYTYSLDALVPVWEKLNLKKISPRFAFSCSQEKPFYCEIMYSIDERDDWDGSFHSIGKTIQQAAAHATAKAILELKD